MRQLLFLICFMPIVAKAQVEAKTDSVKVDTPKVLTLHFDIFKDSTWGKGGLNTRMTKSSEANGTLARVFQSIDKVVEGDLICEFFNNDATIIVREVIKSPIDVATQESAPFSLKIQNQPRLNKVEIRRVRKDNKTEKLGSFKLNKTFGG
jgi:hypothetical protein